jgi:hypothetical protein
VGGENADVAGVVSFLASRDSDYVTGQAVSVDGGLRPVLWLAGRGHGGTTHVRTGETSDVVWGVVYSILVILVIILWVYVPA